MVRDKRRRYVIVEVEGGLSQRELVDYLKSYKGGGELWLIYYDGKKAIIRTDHRSKEKAVEYLNIELRWAGGQGKTSLRTIGVTGTIKKARMKYFGGIPIPRGPRRSPSGDRRRRGRKRK
ncbi:MAG: hypothetical protein J7K08_05560 [Thermoplasmata archaeon]|nr:hypothetical protein [Thermoplasmata archaeon]